MGMSLMNLPIPGISIKGVKAIKVVTVDVNTGQNILVAAAE